MPNYEINALSKGLLVLQALEGSHSEPVTFKRIVERTRLNSNYCFRALKTLEIAGLARETERGWMTTTRLRNLAV
ncbi:MAG: hypothetical protein M3525_08380 [Acidobacteriota bacterium]|nr:hypothetical protein [Acidobacteriota bacterium]